MDLFSGGIPSITKRVHSGHGTFKFSGTAKNSGNSTSNVLTIDLTNDTKIPPHAIVTIISTGSNISYNVGGVHHQLNPGNLGWMASSTSVATSGNFDFSGYNIEVKQPWQFRYSQTATKSTEMNSINMNISWDYDVQYTNYELFN